jgi:hypothetical protein
MEIGPHGVHGLFAPNHVEEETKVTQEIAAVHHLLMVDLTVVEMQLKHKLVIVRLVQQVNIFFSFFFVHENITCRHLALKHLYSTCEAFDFPEAVRCEREKEINKIFVSMLFYCQSEQPIQCTIKC